MCKIYNSHRALLFIVLYTLWAVFVILFVIMRWRIVGEVMFTCLRTDSPDSLYIFLFFSVSQWGQKRKREKEKTRDPFATGSTACHPFVRVTICWFLLLHSRVTPLPFYQYCHLTVHIQNLHTFTLHRQCIHIGPIRLKSTQPPTHRQNKI